MLNLCYSCLIFAMILKTCIRIKEKLLKEQIFRLPFAIRTLNLQIHLKITVNNLNCRFEKMLPKKRNHQVIMINLTKEKKAFGGGNRISVCLINTQNSRKWLKVLLQFVVPQFSSHFRFTISDVIFSSQKREC